MLKLGKEKSVIEVPYHEFEALVQKHYNNTKYSFVASEECGNDSEHSFTAEKEELDEYDIEEIEKFKSNQWVPYITSTLFQDLANNDIIEEGEYLITVCW